MTTYALGALYAPHSKHLVQSADFLPDLRACLNYSRGAVYAYPLKISASIPDIRNSIRQLGLFCGE